VSDAVQFEALSSELVRKIRGKRSQRAFSRGLGFESNVVYSWEAGRRSPETSLFLGAAERRSADLGERLLRSFRDLPPELEKARLGSPRTVQLLVSHLVGRANKAELSRRILVDRTTLGRWLNGKTEPRLPEFLRLIDVTTQRLLAFVALFADPAKLEATRTAHRDLMVQRKLAYDLPWSHAILRALELERYVSLSEHCPGVLAEMIGIAPKDEENYLEQLEAAGQIGWNGQRYVVARVLTVDTREDPGKNV
jgi:transcriptional regulator with XRE-family HTH domain